MSDKNVSMPMRPTVSAQAWPEPARRWTSPLDATRTYGLTDERFHKIVESRQAGPERQQDLRGEFDLLRRCRGVAGVPEALELIEAEGK